MNTLEDYVRELRERRQALEQAIVWLDGYLRLDAEDLRRSDEARAVDAVAEYVRTQTNVFVPDRSRRIPVLHWPLGRRAAAWVVVGPGGVPDDVQVLVEGQAFRVDEDPGPLLAEHRREGRAAYSPEEFFALLEWLRQRVVTGEIVLPWVPL